MGTVGGKRMPIDAVMSTLYIRRMATSGNAATATPEFKAVKGYTAHTETCPAKDLPSTQHQNKGENKP